MAEPMSPALRKSGRIAAFVAVWGFTVWLLYPLIFLDAPTLRQASHYFYRSALAIIIMIILFGKTLTDLFFPLDTPRNKALLQVVFLTVYALAMAGGIILIALRLLLLYMKADSEGTLF
ncbi:MAG: hypothetical protein AB1715_12195 [Acidobacteriota bacterium]